MLWELSYNLHPLAEKACVTDSVKRNTRHYLFVKITTKDLFISRDIISITRSIMFSNEKVCHVCACKTHWFDAGCFGWLPCHCNRLLRCSKLFLACCYAVAKVKMQKDEKNIKLKEITK